MRNLLYLLARNAHWLLFVALELASLTLLFRFNSYQGSVWLSSANAVAGKVYEWRSAVTQYFALGELNRSLSERNVQLEAMLVEAQRRLDAAAIDTFALGNIGLNAGETDIIVGAKVVSNSVHRVDNFITIDKGRADGVEKDMGVVSGTGVVGIVYLVSNHYSVVLPLLNSHSNVSCALQGRGYFGYLHWRGGATDVARLDDVPRHAHFRKGDAVVTSGYSAVFPEGVLVGRLERVFNSADGLSYSMEVRLSTDFGSLRDVFVVGNGAMKEQREIRQAALDSIKVLN